MIFVDTSAWFARYSTKNVHHAAAKNQWQAADRPLVTTDYVVDETLTLLKARGNYEQALRIGPKLLGGSLARLIYAASNDLDAAWHVFSTHRDKAWSFTDCVSYAVMKRLGMTEAMAFDEHFRQFGFAAVRP